MKELKFIRSKTTRVSNSAPEVSVIIPFYANIEWLEEAVKSVLEQTYQNFEIIVVNDGSPENDEKFLFKYENYIRYIKKEHRGAASARNEGIDGARGKYIAFLDSDDLWLPDKLEIQIGEMKKYSAIWSYCGWKTFGIGQSVSYVMTDTDKPMFQRRHSPHIATPSVVIERRYFVEHPNIRFNRDLCYGEDSYLWLWVNVENPILAIPNELVHVRMRGTNAARRARAQLQANSDCWKLRKKHPKELIETFDVSGYFYIASELCIIGNYIVSQLEKFIPDTIVEWVARFLYVIPWSIYRIDRMRECR